MVYSNKFVMCVLVDGHPQEELANGVVKLPFGQEYSLRFRNKNDRRAVVKIYVDGENVSGGGYVIPANDHIDIKRHHDKDRAFKFVELNSPEAVDAGKNGPNPEKSKGLIEARFYLEKEYKYTPPYYPPIRWKTEEHHHHHHHYPPPPPSPWIRPLWYGAQDHTRVTCDAGNAGSAQYSSGPIGMSDAGADGDMMTSFAPEEKTKTCSIGGSSANAGGDIAQFKRISLDRRSRLKTSMSEQHTNKVELSSMKSAPELRDGCTVEGGSTGQSFGTVYIDLEDNYTTLKVFLQGYEDDHVEEAPKRKPKSKVIDELEAENERLRKELAELENQKLKDELEKKKATAKKPRAKKAKKKADQT
jgi:hypothetical protein